MRVTRVVFLVCLVGSPFLRAQSSNSGPGIDSLNATFVPVALLNKQDVTIVNATDHIDILNVSQPTEVLIYDLGGKEVYKSKIDKKARIEKDGFEKGFYIIRLRSVLKESVKKLYL